MKPSAYSRGHLPFVTAFIKIIICAMAVLKAMENCISKEKFIEKKKQFGWSVNWTEKRKHITFQNQDGKKVRDSNLSNTLPINLLAPSTPCWLHGLDTSKGPMNIS